MENHTYTAINPQEPWGKTATARPRGPETVKVERRSYDPVALAEKIEPLVAPGRLRWYHRFRVDRWYGGIATGDIVGCNLRCGFCWAWRFAWKTRGRLLLGPEEAVEAILGAARRKRRRIRQVRLSGGEPTIGFEHLLGVVEEATSRGLHFVLETNGILLGAKPSYARRLAEFHGAGIEVRVSVKGTSPEEFHTLTGAEPNAWYLQVKALENLVAEGLEPGEEVYPAVMLSFTRDPHKAFTVFKRLVAGIDSRLAEEAEPEYVILYPHVEELLRMRRLRPVKAYRPGEVPPELV